MSVCPIEMGRKVNFPAAIRDRRLNFCLRKIHSTNENPAYNLLYGPSTSLHTYIFIAILKVPRLKSETNKQIN